MVMAQALDESDRRYLAALEAIRADDFGKAVELLEPLIRENPQDLDCLLLMAECALKVGNLLQALRAARGAYEAAPQDRTVLSLLGMLYSRLFLHELAVDLLPRAIQDGEPLEENYFYLSNSYFFLRQNRRAIQLLEEALELHPHWNRLRHQLGMLYLFEKEKRKAKRIGRALKKSGYPLADDFLRMIQEDHPDRDRLLDRRFKEKAKNLLQEAEHWLRASNPAEAVKKLVGALEANDELALAYTLLGKILAEWGLIDEALSLHRTALRLDPALAVAYCHLAYALRLKGDDPAALTAYQKALELDPDLVEAHNSLGQLYEYRKEFEKSLWHFRKALEIDPRRMTTLINLGHAYRTLGRVQESLRAYQLASEYHPRSFRGKFFMGDIYLEIEEYEKAEEVLTEALKIEPDSLCTWLKLAESYKARGNEARFQEALRKVLSLPPKDPYEIFFVARVMEEVDIDRAIHHYQNFLRVARRIPLDPEDVAQAKARLSHLLGPMN
jgi:tetratricopeptide (TPR) repeat protein